MKGFSNKSHIKEGSNKFNYIKIFQNALDLLVSVGNNYSEDHFMHIFMGNFRQSGKYSDQMASHQAELRREGKNTDQKHLCISSLQTDYINLDRSSGSGKNN